MDKKLKTILVAASGIGLTATQRFLHKKPSEILVVDVDYDLVINGIKYKKISLPQKPQSSRSIGKMLAMTSLMTITNPYSGSSGGGEERKRPVVDLVEEFERIQNKKSTLSRNDREWVEHSFRKLYKEI